MPKPVLKDERLVDKVALQYLKSKKLAQGFSHYDIWLYEHATQFTVAKMMDFDLLAETREAIADALNNGTSFYEFKKRLKPYLMSRGWWGEQVMVDPFDGKPKLVQLGSTRRLRTIFHTNMHTAYAHGQWQRIQKNKKALPYLKYIGSTAKNKREAHRRFAGLILPVDDPFWSSHFPPNGYGCQCSVRQLTRQQAGREGGVSESPDIETVEVVNQRTGEIKHLPEGVTPSFAHNPGDRLGALFSLYQDKLSNYPGRYNTVAAQRELHQKLNQYMLDKVERPNFNNLGFSPSLWVNKAKVDKHIEGTVAFQQYKERVQKKNIAHSPSIINPYIDNQTLVYLYAGTGESMNDIEIGKPGSKEKITIDREVGLYMHRHEKPLKTNSFIIIYGKEDVHIYPAYPEKYL